MNNLGWIILDRFYTKRQVIDQRKGGWIMFEYKQFKTERCLAGFDSRGHGF